MTGAPRPSKAGVAHRLAFRLSAVRANVRALRGGRLAWRLLTTLAGLVIILVGIVLLPLPGPGWLIIFAGMGVLASEYAWAARALARVRQLVSVWTRWLAAQGVGVRTLIWVCGMVLLAGLLWLWWYLYKFN